MGVTEQEEMHKDLDKDLENTRWKEDTGREAQPNPLLLT